MILNSYQIMQRLQRGVLENWQAEAINAASYDVHLGKFILVETLPESTRYSGISKIVSLKQKDQLTMTQIDLETTGHFLLRPGQFILAQTIEKFNMPLDLSAEYKLKSSMARIGLEHLNAGFIDAGFHGSVLTLEFRNLTTFHEIELCYGDRIGQLIFFQHEPVEMDDSYAVKGRYNGLDKVSAPLTDKHISARNPEQLRLPGIPAD
jgi:dCTP deaminase